MATKEENQVLINQFVEKNVDAINTLESAKQKAVLDAIIMIQNKFGTIQQSTFKDDVIKPLKKDEKQYPFKRGDVFINPDPSVSNLTFTIISIDEDNEKVWVKIEKNGIRKKEKEYEINDFIDDIDLGFKQLMVPFGVGDTFTMDSPAINTIIAIDYEKNYFEFETDKGLKLNGWSYGEAKYNFQKGLWKILKRASKKSKAKTTSTTSTTSTLPSGTSGTSGTSGSSAIVMPSNTNEEIVDLEEAIEAQKLLLSFAETKEEKDEIKELLKDLRSQLKKLKK